MNIDIDVLRATLGELVLQSVLLQSQLKSEQAKSRDQDKAPPKEE